mmetsp:Transcript_58085/g.136129  ORF Transcript_58085/g.136129 Transcript_58085/m.136129 type:complete len:182 (-) Transcript_58085:233-778(-)
MKARSVACAAMLVALVWLDPPISFTTAKPRAATRVARQAAGRVWGGLTPEDRRKRGGGVEHLGEFLYELSQLTPCRYIVNGLAILESTSDMRAGRALLSITSSPKGRSVLVLRSQDSSFQLKLDADSITRIKLEESETGVNAIRFVDDSGRRHLSVVMLGDDAEARFQIMMGRWSSNVNLR